MLKLEKRKVDYNISNAINHEISKFNFYSFEIPKIITENNVLRRES